MTNAQQNTINALRRAMLKRMSLDGLREAEVKHEDIDHREGAGSVFFILEVGVVGDEGTMLEIVGRNRRQFMIGERGGVSLMSVSEGFDHQSFGYKQKNGFRNAVAYYPSK